MMLHTVLLKQDTRLVETVLGELQLFLEPPVFANFYMLHLLSQLGLPVTPLVTAV